MAVKDEVVYESAKDSFSKSNTLISSKYKASLFEQKILNVVLATLQQRNLTHSLGDSDEDLVCELKASELKHILNTTSGSFYAQLKPVAAAMASKTIGFINEESKTFKYVSLISYAEYKDGTFTVKFNNELKRYLSPTTQFTVLELQTILQYKSIYALRLHEILLSRCYKKKKSGVSKYTSRETDGRHFKIEIELNELKLCLGVVNAESSIVQRALAGAKIPDYEKAVEKASEKSFNTWYELRRKVIEAGVKEINKTDNGMHVEYEPLKSGKGAKVYAVLFYVELTRDEPDIVDENYEELTAEREFEVQFQTKSLIKEQLSLKDIKTICEAAKYDFAKIQKAYTVASSASNINNLVGFMIKAIKDEYEEPVRKSKPNGFNNFHQREYDYNDLECKILAGQERRNKL